MSKAVEAQIKEEMEKIADNPHFFSDDIPADYFQLTAVVDYFGDVRGKRILDLGCGKGRFTKRFTQLGAKMTGLDISERLIAGARKNVPKATFVQGTGTQLPFKDGTFDAVFSIETLEHIPDHEATVREIARVLKPGGKVAIIDKSLYSLHPTYLVPTFLKKWIDERRGTWIYSGTTIDFREQYFTRRSLDDRLRRYFSRGGSVKLKQYGTGPKTLALLKKYPVLKLRTVIVDTLYQLLPALRFYILWRWEK